MLALTRRRSLFVAIALLVTLSGAAAPTLAWTHGHCLQATDQDHLPALLEPRLPPVSPPVGFAEPVLLLLGKTQVQARFAGAPRRALPFESGTWKVETGTRELEGQRGLMVPGLLRTGRLAGMAEPDVRALLGESDCPAAPVAPSRPTGVWSTG